jgi:hypothetical protein
MTTQELLASLTAVQSDGFTRDDGSYFDWSSRAYAGGRLWEVGNSDGHVVQVELGRSEMVALHAALTATLLRDQEG